MNWRNAAAAAIGALGLLFGGVGASRAESGAGPEAMMMGNMCMVMFGYDMIHITVYDSKSRSEYCSEIPDTGRLTFSFDIANPKFRDYPLELRIIRDPLTPVDPNGDLSAMTELHVPAKIYSKGTFPIEHTFNQGGHYIGFVTITREDGKKETSSFKFTIGETLWGWVPQIAGVVLIAGMVFVYWKHTHPPKKPAATATQA